MIYCVSVMIFLRGIILNNILYSSAKDNWRTPPDLFFELDREFHFTLDACADDKNHLLDHYYTKFDSCLDHSWSNERVFINPPYGRQIYDFVRKCYLESYSAQVIVALLPVRTDTHWFHNFINGVASIRFIRGRVKFLTPNYGYVLSSAPFPSMICIWGGSNG